MSLMSGLYVGVSGLQTSQNSLNTVAHNLSNEGTTGYVRQQVLQSDTIYNTIKNATTKTTAQQVGIGTVYKKVRQVRDYFLDQSYRRESGRSAFYDASYTAINEVEDLLDELDDDASFNKAMNNFWSSLEELQKTPDDTTVQRLLVQNAQSLLTNASQVYQGLVDYQNELNLQIKDMVTEINDLGNKIYSLNLSIEKVEAGGIETANDLRDQRNEALDELAELANISYDEDIFGGVRVQLEGKDFVTNDTVYTLNTVEDTVTGYYTPYWEISAEKVTDTSKAGDDVYTNEDGYLIDISNARVFDTTDIISSEDKTDVGKLRAYLYIRGDKNANYTDIPVKPEVPEKDDYATDADYAAAVKQYNIELERYEADTTYYNETVAQSICMNTEAEFDQLIHNIVTTVNKILEDVADPTTGYMCEDGHPIQLFQKISSDGYVKDPDTGLYYSTDSDGNIHWNYMDENSAQDASGKYYQTNADGTLKYEDGELQFNEASSSSYYTETLYSITNLQINPSLVREAGKLSFVLPDGNVDYDTAKAFVDAFDADDYVLNPNVTTKCSLNTYYSNLVSQVANTGSVYKNVAESQQATVDSISYSREQVQGVSSDEELSNMIKYQNAYNASSRYINVLNEMLEQLLSSLT